MGNLYRITLASLVLLAGCSSPNPALYTIAAVPGTPQPGGPPLVVLREINVAHYLERTQIVRSSDNYRLNVQSNDWWGEAPGTMLTRVLVQELSQRMPGTDVFPELGAISPDKSTIIELNLQRLDADADNAMVLVAQIAVTGQRAGAPTRRRMVHLSVPVAGPDTRSTVVAISVAVGQLADIITSMLRGG
jgi:uncharacterized lipoprotein YmbA